MTHIDIVTAIHIVLSDIMAIPQIQAFSEEARLNEDLYLDSVLVLELILNLETELGLDIPDEVLIKDEFDTVASLAVFLNTHISSPADTEISSRDDASTEEFEDIKVHCFVSCVCEMIKSDPRVDHRPFYFGVWDAEIIVDDNAKLAYHSDNINHDFFRHWYRKLYGAELHTWYQESKNKAENINTLLTLLNDKSETTRVMVMLDMYRLPERENKFNQNPFPHYVLLDETEDPSVLFMTDPDFRWQGPLAKETILAAIASPAVSGGYYFDSRDIRETRRLDIHDYFIACFNANHNPMTDAIRGIIDTHLNPQQPLLLSVLADALTQIPVLAIRKYAYEHGFAYFWREMNLNKDSFEAWCVVIEELVENYKLIHFIAMKLSKSNTSDGIKEALIEKIYSLLDQQDQLEFRIKKQLASVFKQWQQLYLPDPKQALAGRCKREEVSA